MPYIKSHERDRLDTGDEYENKPGASADEGGQLNYLITRLCWNYYNANGKRYQQINDVLGALEGAKLEFYRRVAVPYEDTKLKENGDVYVK